MMTRKSIKNSWGRELSDEEAAAFSPEVSQSLFDAIQEYNERKKAGQSELLYKFQQLPYLSFLQRRYSWLFVNGMKNYAIKIPKLYGLDLITEKIIGYCEAAGIEWINYDHVKKCYQEATNNFFDALKVGLV